MCCVCRTACSTHLLVYDVIIGLQELLHPVNLIAHLVSLLVCSLVVKVLLHEGMVFRGDLLLLVQAFTCMHCITVSSKVINDWADDCSRVIA